MTGSDFGFMPNGDDPTHFLVWVPSASYASGTPFAGTATFAGKTLSNLGGTYAWGVGSNTITLTTAAVPEPST